MQRIAISLAAAVGLGLAGCQGPGGRAIEGRLSGSLHKMWHGVSAMFGSEIRRSERFVARTREVDFDPGARLARLVGHAGRGLSGISSDAWELPHRVTSFVSDSASDTVHRMGSLTNPKHPLIEANRPATLLAKLRNGARAFVQAITSRYVLPGPGDPDRTADPTVRTRQETWIERLLQRF